MIDKFIPIMKGVQMDSKYAACAFSPTGLVHLAAIVLLFSGCASKAWYISRNSERPIEIHHAIKEGRVCEGMNPKEVKLAWGDPQETKRMSIGYQTIDVWNYTEKTSSDRSNIFKLDVPVASVMFSNSAAGPVVFDWIRYDEVVAGEPDSKDAVDVNKKVPSPQPAASSHKIALPRVTPGVDLSKWPRITVSGIIVSGAAGGAMLNGTYVASGRSISGVTLTAVTETDVYLTYGGETIMLGKGESAGAVSSGGLLKKRK
jgi:hypothetical protein